MTIKTRDFLAAVLPPEDDCYWWFCNDATERNKPGYGLGYSGYPANALRQWVGGRRNVWFSFVGFADPEGGRKASNAKLVKCFVLDVDVGKGEGYADKNAATAALGKHIAERRLPRLSYVVDSGNGLHLYWVLDKALPANEWKAHAERFKQHLLAVDPKLAQDTTRVSDLAGLLRVPGTSNYKDNADPKLVVAKGAGTIYTLDGFLSFIPEHVPVVAPQRSKQRDATHGGGFGFDQQSRDHDARELIKRCEVVRAYYSNQNEASEPQWRSIIQLTTFTKQGVVAAHVLSNQYAGYSPEETDRKFAETLEQTTQSGVGPITCARLRAEFGHEPNFCAGCPLANSASSPVWIERKAVPAVTAVAVVEPEQEDGFVSVKPPVIPTPVDSLEVPEWLHEGHSSKIAFVRGNRTFVYGAPPPKRGRPKKEDAEANEEAEDAEDVALPIVDGVAFWPVRSIVPLEQGSGKRVVEWAVKAASAAPFFCTTTLATFNATQAYAAVMGDKFGASLGANIEASRVRAAKLLSAAMGNGFVETAYSVGRLGWYGDDKFVLPSAQLTSRENSTEINSVVVDGGVRSVLDRIKADSATPMVGGTLAEHSKALQFVGDKGDDKIKWLTAMALGTPMLRFGENRTGLHVHMVGESGVGKTTMMRFLDGLYFLPNGAVLSGVAGDTIKGSNLVKGAMHNIMLTWDEFNTTDPTAVRTAIMAGTQGRGNAASTQDGKIREHVPTWMTNVLSSGNSSIVEVVVDGKHDQSEASAARLHEMHIDKHMVEASDSEFRVLGRAVADNYGHIGAWFMTAVMSNLKWCRERVSYNLSRIRAARADRSDNLDRFYEDVAAATVTAAEIMERLGMWNVSADSVLAFSIEQRKHAVVGAKVAAASCEDVVSDIFAHFRSRATMLTGVYDKEHNAFSDMKHDIRNSVASSLPADNNCFVVHDPRTGKVHLYVRPTALLKFAKDAGFSSRNALYRAVNGRAMFTKGAHKRPPRKRFPAVGQVPVFAIDATGVIDVGGGQRAANEPVLASVGNAGVVSDVSYQPQTMEDDLAG